ncbi:PhzF family phenazine biosynthesis protein, partial [Acinetobacter baumannii]
TPEGRAAGADYRVRIFCPGRELPFAGHPTLGSCHAWLKAGGEPRSAGKVVQECGVGLVTLRQDGARLAFAAPPLIKSGP